MTLIRFTEFFFDDVLVDMIVDCNNFDGHREKADISFEITKWVII